MAAAVILFTRPVISRAARREKVSLQNTLRMDAVDHQMSNPVGERLGLARTGASNHKQRWRINSRTVFYAVPHCTPLFFIQVS